MEGSDYWSRWTKRRLSRRRVLTGAAGVGAGLAALSLVGCGGGGENGTSPTPGVSPGASPTGTTATATTGEPGKVFHRWGDGPHPALVAATARGGVNRAFGYEPMTLDTFDPHQTQFGPTYSMHSLVFSKILKYWDAYHGIRQPDLAEAIPEMPDNLTYIIKIRDGVRFHDTEKARQLFPEVAGRQLTAEDVKYSIERQINPASPRRSLYYRATQWETIDKIELVDALTLRITTKKPTAPFMHYLADSNNYIIAKELVDPVKDDMNSLDKMIGSGPFILDKFVGLQVIRVVRNPDWFAKDDLADQGISDRPLCDALEFIWQPSDDTSVEVAFRSKQVDLTWYTDPTAPDRIAPETGAFIDECISGSWVNSRMLVADSPTAESPFKDIRLRQAISIAVDRSRLGQQMYQGSCLLVPPVAQALVDWSLPLEELTKRPGFRFKREEREQDLVQAKQLWDAGGGPSIGTVEVMYPAIPDNIKASFPQFQRQLQEALDFEVKGHLDPTGYTEIGQAALLKRMIFSFNLDNGYLEPDDYLYTYFHSTGPKNSFNLSDPTLDQMLEAQREEFDQERRQQLVYDIQRYLLDNVVARLDLVSQINRGTRWPYCKNMEYAPWFGDVYCRADVWLDSNDPTFQGRPA
jgi:peptide/nickel transport system substrate-binding protein